MPPDVQVFVRFKDRCVFAGEEFSCTITFKNVADTFGGSTSSSSLASRSQPRFGSSLSQQSSRPSLPGRSSSRLAPGRSSQQLHLPLNSPPIPKEHDQITHSPRPDGKHQRSVSIVSIGSLNSPNSPDQPYSNLGRGGAALGHRRSSTVQHIGNTQRRPSPGRHLSSDLRTSVKNGRRSPLSNAHSFQDSPPVERPQDFKFPPDHLLNASTPESAQGTPILGPRRRPARRNVAGSGSNQEALASQPEGAEFYAHSNHSEETVMSEQPSLMSERPQPPNMASRPGLIRNNSLHTRKPQAASLLMGYAQVNASFTLDASLVDQTPFEEVKKKGFLGGQAGGGVVGVKKKTRPNSGLLSSLGFGSLGESLESIMGGDNLSSVKEMKAVTNSRAIPLLSTPQSLLFVDLQLEPGDEKSYSFSYKLPKGLPSSYRGKAIKIVYNLTIGVQGAPGNREMQAVRQVNIPIRVFSGVDPDGEIFGHDLMQPYVILKDVANTKAIELSTEEAIIQSRTQNTNKISATDFLQYVDRLLDKSRRRQSSTGTVDAMFGTFAPEKSAAIRAINRAIMTSNQITATSESSPNRFEIARSGLKIATVILNRPLHRLGETVSTVIDLSESQMSCASLRATLESAERVSNSLTVRSAAAISRITKKVYASRSENVLFATRAVFCPTIPSSATPTFVTSGVNLEWYIKLEFGTVRMNPDESTSSQPSLPKLLEEVVEDERGNVNIAVESLDCDTFEVMIPITVYGDLIIDSEMNNDVVGVPI